MASSDGSEASPDLQEGSCLDVTQYLLLFFIGLRGLTARAVRHCLLFHQGKSEQASAAMSGVKFLLSIVKFLITRINDNLE